MPDTPAPTPRVALVWSDELADAPSPEGTLWAERARASHQVLEAVGALGWAEVQVVPVDEAAAQLSTLRGYHDAAYLLTVRALGEGTANLSFDSYGFGSGGVAAYRGMAVQASRGVASALSALRAASDKIPYAVSVAATQPHARPAEATSGHLINDVVLALQAAKESHGRVALVSLDAEFAPAVHAAFASDGDVFTSFLHEGTAFLYPGGSVPSDAVSVSLPPGAGDAHYLAALERVIEPGLTHHRPQMLIVAGGASAHPTEPLAHLRLTTTGYAQLIERLMGLAPRLVVLAGESSLPLTSARFSAVALATLAARPLPPALPASLARVWGHQSLHDAPLRPLSKPMRAFVEERVEEAIVLAQRNAFPQWGLAAPSSGPLPLDAIRDRPTESESGAILVESNERLQAIRAARQAPRQGPGHSVQPTPTDTPTRGHRDLGTRRRRRR